MPKRSDVRLTARTMPAIIAKGAGVTFDAGLPGFGLRVLPSGRAAWVFKYRAAGGQQRWHRIGEYPALAPDEARRLALAAKAGVDAGRDPVGEREAAEAAAVAQQRAQALRLADAYAKALPGRPKLRGEGAISARHADQEGRAVKAALARAKADKLPVAAVTARHIEAMLREEAARPATARMLFGALSRFLDWCRDEGHIATNPALELAKPKRPRPARARSHVVALADIACIWKAAEELPAVQRDAARFLVAVPCRQGEAAELEWSQLDLRQGVWSQPAALTKNGDPHRIALHPLALEILERRHREAGEPREGLVFPGELKGKPLTVWGSMARRLRGATGLDGWRWHDFRRSFASTMAERGIPEPVADAVLNHRQSATRGGVLGVYQQAQRWPEQRQAMQAWGHALAEVLRPRKGGAAVVPLRRPTARA